MNWIKYNSEAFNLNEFRHIWIEKGVNGFFIMGEFLRDLEEVVLSSDFQNFFECENCMNKLLNLYQLERSKREDKDDSGPLFKDPMFSNQMEKNYP